MEVKIKLLTPEAKMPYRKYPTDAGYDLFATSFKQDDAGCYIFGTGIAMEIPEGYVGLVFPRSSISKTDLFLSNSVGVIDSHYRGEITFKFKSTIRCESLESMMKNYGVPNAEMHTVNNIVGNTYAIGDRIGQIIIMPIPQIEFVPVPELSSTDRGEGGYGSTGK